MSVCSVALLAYAAAARASSVGLGLGQQRPKVPCFDLHAQIWSSKMVTASGACVAGRGKKKRSRLHWGWLVLWAPRLILMHIITGVTSLLELMLYRRSTGLVQALIGRHVGCAPLLVSILNRAKRLENVALRKSARAWCVALSRLALLLHPDRAAPRSARTHADPAQIIGAPPAASNRCTGPFWHRR